MESDLAVSLHGLVHRHIAARQHVEIAGEVRCGIFIGKGHGCVRELHVNVVTVGEIGQVERHLAAADFIQDELGVGKHLRRANERGALLYLHPVRGKDDVAGLYGRTTLHLDEARTIHRQIRRRGSPVDERVHVLDVGRRRGKRAADIHHRALPEKHARRIEQPDVRRTVDRAEDLRHPAIRFDEVEEGSVVERGRLPAHDIESVPFDRAYAAACAERSGGHVAGDSRRLPEDLRIAQCSARRKRNRG